MKYLNSSICNECKVLKLGRAPISVMRGGGGTDLSSIRCMLKLSFNMLQCLWEEI